MCGLCDKGRAPASHRLRDLADDRPDAAARDKCQIAQNASRAIRRRLAEFPIRKRHAVGHRSPVIHPDHGRAGTTLMIGQRDQRKGTASAVYFG